MHFWDLFNALKDDADFYFIHNSTKTWFYETRPLPENAQFVPYYEPNKYDLAILDVDQQCTKPNMGKSKLYKGLNQLIQDIPKIVINHGSPVWPEYHKIGDDQSFEYAEEKCKKAMREIVGDNPMVVNSYQSATLDEWGWGIPIWHGMNPDDWWDLPKEPRVFTSLSAGGCDTYYNRECMHEVATHLDRKYGIKLNWARINVETGKSFDKYREFLGRSLVYLDTSVRTPMNRARTESQLSGSCVVQVEGAHDLERFVKPNENMIIVPNNPEYIADVVHSLLETQYEQCLAVGQAGKKTALENFNYKRYREDWIKQLSLYVWR